MGLVVVKNIGLLLTMSNRLAIADAVVVIKDGVIEWVGPSAEFDLDLYQDCTVIDADGGLVPGIMPKMRKLHSLPLSGNRIK